MTGPGEPERFAEWPAKVAGAVEDLAGVVRSKAVRPLERAARAVVFGLLAALVGLVAVVLAAIGTLRVFDVYVFAGRQWASYLLVGALFGLGGLALSVLRRPRGATR